MAVKAIQRFFTDDKIVAGVILLNAVVLFLLAFDEIIRQEQLSLSLELVDALFILYFLFEAIFKIRELGWRAYIANGWNRFDFIIVVISIPSILLLFKSAMNDLSFVFVLRIIRVIRFFKFMRFIPNVESLFAGISRAFRASVFVFVALFIYTFVISLISCKLFKEISPEAHEYFGDPITSFYSIFKIFTIEGWYEIPEAIVQGQPAFFKFFTLLYFIGIVVTGGLFGLSIVNAIFVDEMVKDNNDDLLLRVAELDKKLETLLALHALPPESSDGKPDRFHRASPSKKDFDMKQSVNKE